MTKREYYAPVGVGEASRLLLEPGAVAVAGGTDLVVLMQEGLSDPRHLVDLRCLDLSYVREEPGLIRIGATTTFASLIRSEMIADEAPVLAEAAAELGAVQTRNAATIGGNICSAVPSADAAPPLLVLDAAVRLYGPPGWRTVPLQHFFLGPRKTILAPGELLVEFLVPHPPASAGMKFLKLGRRKALTLAIVNVAVLVVPEPGGRSLVEARIALGAVAPTPIRAPEAELFLQGRPFSAETVARGAEIAATEIQPIDDMRASASYRRKMTRLLTARALTEAWRSIRQAVEGEGS